MSAPIKKLRNIHRVIARKLAIGGYDLRSLCELYGLRYERWKQIVASPLFEAEVERLHEEAEEKELTEALDDPHLLVLRSEQVRAARRLATERDNFKEKQGASAATRIKAATAILDRAVGDPQELEGAIFYLSKAQLLAVKKAEKPLAEQPVEVDGHQE